jgi:hypothetical protein
MAFNSLYTCFELLSKVLSAAAYSHPGRERRLSEEQQKALYVDCIRLSFFVNWQEANGGV